MFVKAAAAFRQTGVMMNQINHGKYYQLIDADSKAVDLNLKELWHYRDLISLLVRRDFISKYKQTVLGPAWAIIQPLMTTLVFTFIFGNVAHLADCGNVPEFLFYMAGNISWAFFEGCLTGTANTFIQNSGLMGKVYFPRLCVPIASVLSQMISFGIQIVLFFVFLAAYCLLFGYKAMLNPIALMFPFFILQMTLLGMGCGMIITACTVKYRDLRFLTTFGVTLWMYITPVAYSLKIFERNTLLFHLCRFNPMTPVIEGIRHGFLGAEAGRLDLPAYFISIGITAGILWIGLLLFNRAEKTFMDLV